MCIRDSFWIQYVVVGAKEVAIRYGYEQYYFHLFAARPLLYFALGALGVTVLQWAGGMLLRRGARRACLVLGIVLAVSYAGCILCLLFGQILPCLLYTSTVELRSVRRRRSSCMPVHSRKNSSKDSLRRATFRASKEAGK